MYSHKTHDYEGGMSEQAVNSDLRKDELRIINDDDDRTANTNDDSFNSEGWYCFRHVPYLSKEAKDGLKYYKYAAGDNAIMAKYFYNPFADWLVNFLPEWLAPNTITLMGFVISIAPFFLVFVLCGTHLYNEEPEKYKIPRWAFFAEGVCYFLYRMLDELDGKQARRTGNSSPLGMLFDHGCDAFTCGLQCLIMAKFL